MRKIADIIRSFLLTIRRVFKFTFLPEQTFLYAACGSANLVWDMFVRLITFHFVLHEENFVTPFYTFSPDIAAFLVAFVHSFPVGFLLSKYVVWTESNIGGRKQLFRYFMVVLICFTLNIGFIKLFAHVLNMPFLLSALLAAIFVIITSYILQRFFSFKIIDEIVDIDDDGDDEN